MPGNTLVENPINWIIANEDTQLKVAVEELLKDVQGGEMMDIDNSFKMLNKE